MLNRRIEEPCRMILLGVVLLLVSSVATAQVVELNVFKPLPGKGGLSVQYGQEARDIQTELGAQVVVSQDTEGRLLYALVTPNWTEWAAFGDKLGASPEWSAFQAKISAAPSAELEEQYFLNIVSATDGPINVFQNFVWEPEPGRGNELVAGAPPSGGHPREGGRRRWRQRRSTGPHALSDGFRELGSLGQVRRHTEPGVPGIHGGAEQESNRPAGQGVHRQLTVISGG